MNYKDYYKIMGLERTASAADIKRAYRQLAHQYHPDISKDDKGKDQLVSQQRFVTTGETRGDQIIVLAGITTQDEVISAGANKLKNGSLIAVNNKVTLPNDANPHPKEQ